MNAFVIAETFHFDVDEVLAWPLNKFKDYCAYFRVKEEQYQREKEKTERKKAKSIRKRRHGSKPR